MSIFSGANNPGVELSPFTELEVEVLQEIASLPDPNTDSILFWDDSANSYGYLMPGSGLSITDTTLSVNVNVTDSFARMFTFMGA